ncbi:MAG: fibronectin type III domain-containing protein [Candidatus Helarchaeota archaeon]
MAAVDDGGPVQNVGQNSTATSGIPTDITPPPKITWSANPIKVIPEGNALNITWNPSTASDFQEYWIYRNSTAENWTLIATTNISTYLDTGLTNGITYWYKISAVDEVPNAGTNSTAKSAIPKDTIPPSAITTLTVTVVPTGNTLNISWNYVSDSDMYEYRIYRSTVAGFTPSSENNIANVSHPTLYYVDTGLTDGITYYYKVISVDDDNNYLPPTTQKSGKPSDTVPPLQPENFTVTNINGSLYLEWTAAQEDDFVKYEIWRNGSFILVQTIYNKTQNYWLDSSDNLIDGIAYYYEIRVYDEVGYNSTAPPKYSPIIVPTGDNKPPANVTTLSAINILGGYVRLTWASPGTYDIKYYNIYRSTVSGFTPNASNLIGNTTETVYYDYSSNLNGTGITYYYQVRAVDENGNMATGGNEASVSVIDTVRPSSVLSFKVLAQSDGSMKLVWTASTPADFYRYNIYRYEGYNPSFITDSSTLIYSIYDNNTLYYIDSQANLVDGLLYSYKIAVADEVGDSTTRFAFNSTSGDTVAPSNVTNGNAYNEGTGDILILNWSINPENDVDHYNIYRSTISGFVPDQSNLIAQTSYNYYNDTGLTEYTTYYYRVTAVDEVGNEGNPCAEFNGTPVDIKPPGPPTLIPQPVIGRLVIILIQKPADLDVEYYNIYRSNISDSGPWVLIAANYSSAGEITSYPDPDLPIGTYYYYAVALDEKYQQSGPSNIINNTIVLAAPLWSSISDNGNGDISLQWTDNLTNPDAFITGYKIYRKLFNDTTFTYVGYVSHTLGITSYSFVDYGVPDGNWSYYVTTIDRYLKESPYSKPIYVLINDTISPGAPTNLLRVSPDGSENITISWSSPTDNNYGADVAYYEIYILPRNFSSISGLTANATIIGRTNNTYTFYNVSDGFYYIVCIAYDEKNHSSIFSNMITLTVDTTDPIIYTSTIQYKRTDVAAGNPVIVNISVYDRGGIQRVYITYVVNGKDMRIVDMTLVRQFSNGTQVWRGEIPGQAAGSIINFTITVVDKYGHIQTSGSFVYNVVGEKFPTYIIIIIVVAAVGAVAAVITITRLTTKEKKKEYVAEELLPLPI